MPSNKKRTILFEVPSKSGRFVFRFYSTGSLSVLDPLHLEPNANGSDAGFLKINNLTEEYETGELSALLDKLDETVVLGNRAVLEYYRAHSHHLLTGFINQREGEPILQFAAFAAGIEGTREVPYAALLERVSRNRHLLDKALDFHVIGMLVRPDLGLASADLLQKVVGLEALDGLLLEIEARRGRMGYSIAFERMVAGIPTVASELYKAFGEGRQQRSGALSALEMILTHEESRELRAVINKNAGPNTRIFGELGVLVSYAWVRHGAEKVVELLHFIHKYTYEEYHNYFNYYSLDRIKFGLGELDSNALARALDSDVTPLEWAINLEVF